MEVVYFGVRSLEFGVRSSPDAAGGVMRQPDIAVTPTLNSSDLCALCASVVNPYRLQVH